MVLAPRIYNIITSQTKCDTYEKKNTRRYLGFLSLFSPLFLLVFHSLVWVYSYLVHFTLLDFGCWIVSFHIFSALLVILLFFTPMKSISRLYIFKWRWAITHTLIEIFRIDLILCNIYTLTNKISLYGFFSLNQRLLFSSCSVCVCNVCRADQMVKQFRGKK